MHEKFREAWKAANYIGSGLAGDFPGTQVEITYHYRGQVETCRCPVNEASRVIERYSLKFPMATVYYHGKTDYGIIAELRCHCSREKSRGCCKDSHNHRAKVLIAPIPADKEEDATALKASGG